MIKVTWIFSIHHCPVNNVVVVRLPYCLISGAWWSKRATRPKKHELGGIHSTQIRDNCGIWSVWSCVLAFQHRGSLHMVVASSLETRKSVDRGQTHRKYWNFWASFSLFTAGEERTGRDGRSFFEAIRWDLRSKQPQQRSNNDPITTCLIFSLNIWISEYYLFLIYRTCSCYTQ